MGGDDRMCWLGSFFKPKLVLPHPEEMVNLQATIQNIDINVLRQSWYSKYQVLYQEIWDNTHISLIENLHVIINGTVTKVPAATYANENWIDIDPQWANTGVLAHEMAHISYSFLTIIDVAQFNIIYQEVKKDALIKLLESQNQYMKINTIELHAEIYRYLGERMPQSLKTFYPQLF